MEFYLTDDCLIYTKPTEGTFLYDLERSKITKISDFYSRPNTFTIDKLVVLKEKKGGLESNEYIQDLKTKELMKIPGPGRHSGNIILYLSENKDEFMIYDKNTHKNIYRFSADRLGINLENEKRGLMCFKIFSDDEGRFILNFNHKKLWKFEIKTGELTDLTTVKGKTMLRIPKCIINGYLYCLSGTGLLVVIDMKTNNATFFHLEDHFKSYNLIPGGTLGNSETHLFFSSVYCKDVPIEHSVAAFNLKTKKIDWLYKFDTEEVGYGIKEPYYIDGRLYVKDLYNSLLIFEHTNA